MKIKKETIDIIKPRPVLVIKTDEVIYASFANEQKAELFIHKLSSDLLMINMRFDYNRLIGKLPFSLDECEKDIQVNKGDIVIDKDKIVISLDSFVTKGIKIASISNHLEKLMTNKVIEIEFSIEWSE